MKSKLLTLFALFCVLFSNCTKGERKEFDYPIETLFGTWDGVAIKVDSCGEWLDMGDCSSAVLEFGIEFYEDESYYGFSSYGNSSGTYTAEGQRITTYVDGDEFLHYDIVSFSGDRAEVVMKQKGARSEIGIRVKRRK